MCRFSVLEGMCKFCLLGIHEFDMFRIPFFN
jgi:hypothetical protein